MAEAETPPIHFVFQKYSNSNWPFAICDLVCGSVLATHTHLAALSTTTLAFSLGICGFQSPGEASFTIIIIRSPSSS
jgi:hypothetical protein